MAGTPAQRSGGPRRRRLRRDHDGAACGATRAEACGATRAERRLRSTRAGTAGHGGQAGHGGAACGATRAGPRRDHGGCPHAAPGEIDNGGRLWLLAGRLLAGSTPGDGYDHDSANSGRKRLRVRPLASRDVDPATDTPPNAHHGNIRRAIGPGSGTSTPRSPAGEPAPRTVATSGRGKRPVRSPIGRLTFPGACIWRCSWPRSADHSPLLEPCRDLATCPWPRPPRLRNSGVVRAHRGLATCPWLAPRPGPRSADDSPLLEPCRDLATCP